MVMQMRKLFSLVKLQENPKTCKASLCWIGGKFLAEMLSAIKLNREDVYITNIVKYRPPNNRDPLPEEKASCREWLSRKSN